MTNWDQVEKAWPIIMAALIKDNQLSKGKEQKCIEYAVDLAEMGVVEINRRRGPEETQK